jgi:hypothetical protein
MRTVSGVTFQQLTTKEPGFDKNDKKPKPGFLNPAVSGKMAEYITAFIFAYKQ